MEGKREKIELLTLRLYDAALEGDAPSLLNLLQLDRLILDRCSIDKSGRFTQSPLHIAARLGHHKFVMEILCRKPELAEELDHTQRLSPLHMSAANGHLEIVKALVAANPDMCLARNQDGRNPIHSAAIRGQLHVVVELFRAQPHAAKEVTNRGETILHLCVKHRQRQTLESLVPAIDDVELLNFKDSVGSTILHLAVSTGQAEIVKFLLEDKRMDKNAINANGLTAMDICQKSRTYSNGGEILDSLEQAKALRAKAAIRLRVRDHTWSENKRDTLQVVASLIAAMAFQVGINPPGGVWQDDNNGHAAGYSVMAHKNLLLYKGLLISNTFGLISSLSVILLLISGFRYNRYFVGVLMMLMWVAVSATALTFVLSFAFLSMSSHLKSNHVVSLFSMLHHNRVTKALAWAVIAWVILMACLLLGHGIRFTHMLIKERPRLMKKLSRASITTCSPPV